MNSERKIRQMSLVVLIGLSALSLAGSALAQAWIPLRTSGSPPNMYGSEVANYDVDNNRLIVYFPGNPAVPPRLTTQVWVLTNANGLGGTPVWTRLQPAGTPPSSNGNQSVVYDAATNRLIIYGGCFGNCSPALADVFVLSNANGLGGTPVWSQTVITNPQARASHGAVYDATSNRMITFGGDLAFYETCQNDTRVLNACFWGVHLV